MFCNMERLKTFFKKVRQHFSTPIRLVMFGFLAIKWMLKIIRKANYMWFSVYLLCLSLGCFWLNALGLY